MQTRSPSDPFELTRKDRLQHQIFGEIANALPDIAWIASADGAIEYYNRHWFRYTGLTLEHMRENSWQPVVHPDDLERVRRNWAAALASGEPLDHEFRLLRAADGAYRWHRGQGTPIFDGRRVIKWFGVVTDIDDDRRLGTDDDAGREAVRKRLQARMSLLKSALAAMIQEHAG